MQASSPSIGVFVAHLFWTPTDFSDAEAALTAIGELTGLGDQVVTASMLGHKADLVTMLLTSDQWRIRRFQTAMVEAGFELVDSYLSLTEMSEYAMGIPEEMKQAGACIPQLPPEGKPAFCFYPMSKRRAVGQNWFTLPYDDRKDLMMEHGTSGRKFAGRIAQLITGSTGLDDFEWGVTLFVKHPDDIKDVVYTMRFDQASAEYAEFGTFYVGMVATPAEALESIGVV